MPAARRSIGITPKPQRPAVGMVVLIRLSDGWRPFLVSAIDPTVTSSLIHGWVFPTPSDLYDQVIRDAGIQRTNTLQPIPLSDIRQGTGLGEWQFLE